MKVNTEVSKRVAGIPNVSFFDIDANLFINPTDGGWLGGVMVYDSIPNKIIVV